MKRQWVLTSLVVGLSFILGASHSGMPLAATTTDSESEIQQGVGLAPVPLNLQGQNCALGGLGSYINRTPDQTGQPVGLTFTEFQQLIRTGQDPDNPGQLLQVGSASAGGPVQFIPSGDPPSQMIPPCDTPGQTTCINGWRWVCQCYSYGCQYMATSNRCG